MTRAAWFAVLLVPLGAGLLYIGTPAPDSPDAHGRPAPSGPLPVAQPERGDGTPQLDVQRIVHAEIDYEPANAVFLETVLMQGSFAEKKAAIRELRSLASPDAVQALSIALADDDGRVRKAALEALAKLQSEDALNAIASAALAEDALGRARAIETLAMTGDYSAPNYLEIALRDPDPRVRAAAVEALGDVGDSRSVNIISQALRDPDPEVRARAAEVLDALDDEALFRALHPPQ